MKSTAFLLILLCILSSPLLAAQKYIVGVGDYDYLPHHGVVDNEYRGYARDVLDLFSEQSGLIFDYRPLPWKRVILEYIEGSVDFIFPDNPLWDTDAKEKIQVYYSNPVVSYIDGVIVLPENKGKGINHIKTLGTIRGFDVWEDNNYIQAGNVKIAESDDFAPLLKQVLLKHVDGAYIEIAVANYYLGDVLKKSGALVFDPDLPHRKDNYYLSSINHHNIIQEFNEFLEAERSAIEKLQKKYRVGAFAQ